MAIEILQLALDIAGLFPGPGDAFDVIGALISARRGEWLDVLLSVGSAVFLAGIALGIAKIGKRLKKLARLIAKLKGPAREILGNFIEGLAKAIKDIPLNSVQGAIEGLRRFVKRLRELLVETLGKLRKSKRHPGGEKAQRHAGKKPTLRDRMRAPPANMKRPQAHHDLPQKFRNKFEKAGLDIDDPAYGRWVEGGPVGGHQKWSGAFQDEWEEFFATFPNPTRDQILDQMQKLRANPRYQ